jgi:2-polyprenyl-3-methyl-5-hydroxy-6-metoxy-1,4-benzoquinol methylase
MQPACYDDSAIAGARALRARYADDPAMATAEIADELARYVFYHIIEIVPGLETAGIWWTRSYTDTFARVAATLDFRGKRVLDIGCRDGAQSFCMEAAGATELYGIDNDFSPALVNFLVPFRDSRLQCHELNVYDLGHAGFGIFDVVACCGVVYHLQFPFWGLKQMRDACKPGGMLILETAVLEGLDDLPVVAYLTGDTSPYERSSPTFFSLAGLQQALGLLDFGDFTVRDISDGEPIAVERHFPQFHAVNPALNLLLHRVMLTCVRRAVTSDSASMSAYFEGLHRVHSSGKEHLRAGVQTVIASARRM